MDLAGKVVLITGASAGIGAICAEEFAKLHAKLTIVGRNQDKLRHVAGQCEKASGNKPLSIIADVSKEEDVTRIVKETIDHYGRIDVIINNAGILLSGGPMSDVSIYDRITATNVRGPYMLTQQAIPHLLKTKGNIVNISSIVSSVTVPAMMPYSMTKAALDMFTKCMALELAPKGVRVNSVNPGPVDTNLFKTGGVQKDEDFFTTIRARLPLNKVAKSEDVSKLVTFLASDSASCITGSFHLIDCGLHLGEPFILG